MSGTLIVGPAWIGDMVMAHCLVARLHEAHPDQPLHMLAPPATAPVASRMAEVSKVHVLEIGHGEFGLRERYRMGQALAAEGFQRAYVLPNSWKSALVPLFARIPARTGWRGEARYGLLNNSRPLDASRWPLMIERFMALQAFDAELPAPYPEPVLQVDKSNQQRVLAALELGSGRAAVALCPGAEFGQAKRWPIEHFAAVAEQLTAAGRSVWLLGGPADRETCAEIEARVVVPSERGSIHNLAGRTSLEEVTDLLAAAEAVVCNDSGLMHVACAVQTPVIALYGSTSPGFTPPLDQNARALTLVDVDQGARRLACQPCFERTCRFGHGDCLQNLQPQLVLDRLTELGVLSAAPVA